MEAGDRIYDIILIGSTVVSGLIAILAGWKYFLNHKHYAPRSKILMMGLVYTFAVLCINQATRVFDPEFQATWRSAVLLPGLVWVLFGLGITGSLSLRHRDDTVNDMIREIMEGEPCKNPNCVDLRHRLIKAAETDQTSKL